MCCLLVHGTKHTAISNTEIFDHKRTASSQQWKLKHCQKQLNDNRIRTCDTSILSVGKDKYVEHSAAWNICNRTNDNKLFFTLPQLFLLRSWKTQTILTLKHAQIYYSYLHMISGAVPPLPPKVLHTIIHQTDLHRACESFYEISVHNWSVYWILLSGSYEIQDPRQILASRLSSYLVLCKKEELSEWEIF